MNKKSSNTKSSNTKLQRVTLVKSLEHPRYNYVTEKPYVISDIQGYLVSEGGIEYGCWKSDYGKTVEVRVEPSIWGKYKATSNICDETTKFDSCTITPLRQQVLIGWDYKGRPIRLNTGTVVLRISEIHEI